MFALEDDYAKLQTQMSYAVNDVCPEKSVRCHKPYVPWLKDVSVIQAQLDRNRAKKSFLKNKEDHNCRSLYCKTVINEARPS